MIVAELGPGSGTLAGDLLRAAAALPEFRRAMHLHLVEASPVLRAEQRRRLAFAEPVWLSRIDELPAGPALIVANEFLDALPIRQLVRGTAALGGADGGARRRRSAGLCRRAGKPGLVAAGRPRLCADRPSPAPSSSCAPRHWRWQRLSAPRLTRDPGAALFDRLRPCPEPARGELAGRIAPPSGRRAGIAGQRRSQRACRFRRLRRGRPRRRGRRLRTGAARPVSRRARAFRRGSRPCPARATPAQRRQLETGVERLLDPAQMGNLFKAVALTSPRLPRPVGFELAGAPR